MSSIRVLSLDGSLSSSPPPISGGHSRLRIIEGARAGQFFQQDFSQNQQNFDLPGCSIDQQIDSQKDSSVARAVHIVGLQGACTQDSVHCALGQALRNAWYGTVRIDPNGRSYK